MWTSGGKLIRATPTSSDPVAPVLWAEDAESDQLLIRSALEGAQGGARVHFVQDGVEVLDAARRMRPRLIVLDINMPNMGGIEALRQLRQQPDLDDVPVVMFSTSGDAEEIQRSRQLGAVDYVQKPMQLDAFTEAVQTILARAKA